MSHNTIKINSQKPDASGNITQTLNNLSGVSASSPTNGQYLVYSDSSDAWVAGSSTTTTASLPHVWLGEGASQAYPEGWAANNNVYFYAANPVNNITGASLASSDSYSNWYDEITIPAGTYLVQARVEGDFSSSAGVFRYIIATTISGTTTTHAASGVSSDLGNTNQNPDLAQALLVVASQATLSVQIIASGASNLTTSGMSTSQGLYGYLWIAKVG